MISDVVVAYSQLLTKFEGGVNHRLTVEASKYQTARVITVVNLNPHPFALARAFVSEFNFYVVTRSIHRHTSSLMFAIIHHAKAGRAKTRQKGIGRSSRLLFTMGAG